MPYCCPTVLQSSPNRSECQCSLQEYRYPRCVPPFSSQSRQRCSIVCPPVFVNTRKKQSFRSEKFRLFYERGDLPCTIQHTAKGQILKWFVENLETLNMNYYLPIYTDGLCETKYPYSFIAYQGVLDLVDRASQKIDSETLSKMIVPLKRALYTHDSVVISRILMVLQKLVHGKDGAIGIALVPYFNQLLPIINIIKERHEAKFDRNIRQCDMINKFEKNTASDLVCLIDQTLVVLEQFGGPDAFLNIKFSIPTYEQQADVKQLSTAQTNMMMQPLVEIESNQ